MSTVYLVRHGQAGTRLRYDDLSETGRAQARLLGEYWLSQGIEFTAVFSGSLARQRRTAEEVCATYARAGAAFPEIVTDPLWNEFDLEAVYRDAAPALAAADPRFAEAWAEIERDSRDEHAPVHRQWSWCDVEIVRAWIGGTVACRTETWDEFRARVGRARESLARFAPGEKVAVFTSAVPVGIWAAMGIGTQDDRAMQMAAVLYNASFSTIRMQDGAPRLFSFNNTPHLPAAALRTFR